MVLPHQANHSLDCKTVGFFLKLSKEIGKAWRKSVTRANRASLTRPLFSASLHTFCLTARAYLNTQKYGLFCSLIIHELFITGQFITRWFLISLLI